MLETKLFRTISIAILFLFFGKTKAQNCEEYLQKMDSLSVRSDTESAIKMMKFYTACIGENIDATNPKMQRLKEISYLKPFDNNISIAYVSGKGNYLIDRDFNLLKKLKYQKYLGFSEGLSPVVLKENYREKNKYWGDVYGFVNTEDEIVIPALYKYVRSGFHNGVAIVENIDNERAVIDKSGNIVIPYHKAIACGDCKSINYFVFYDGDYKNPLYILHRDGSKYEIPKGIGIFYNNTENFERSTIVPIHMIEKKEYSKGAINNKAEIVIPLDYSQISIKGNKAIVTDGQTKLSGVYNDSGEIILPIQYHQISFFGASNSIVKADKELFALSEHSSTRLNYDFFDEYFHNHLLLVKNDGKYGYIDNKGNLKIPLQYDDALHFEEGKARVKQNNNVFTINTDGNCVQDCK